MSRHPDTLRARQFATEKPPGGNLSAESDHECSIGIERSEHTPAWQVFFSLDVASEPV
jgi:hypothetical protein